SSLELPGAVPYVPEFDGLYLGSPTAEYLQEYAQCALKAWGKRSLPTSWADSGDVPEWIALREALLSEPRLDDEWLTRLAGLHPGAASWLSDHAERLRALNFLPRFHDAENDVVAVVNAGERVVIAGRGPAASASTAPQKLAIYLFAEPDPDADWRWAVGQSRDRWSEYLAAAIALRHRTMAPSYVEFVVWPIYGTPIVVENSSRRYAKERMATVVREISVLARRFRAGDLTPTP